MGFWLALVLVIAFALFTTSLFRHSSKVAYVLSLYLAAWANIVMTGQIAGLLQQVFPVFFIVFQLLLALAAWFGWRKAGKPHLLGPFRGGEWAFWRKLPNFRAAPVVWVLGIGVGAAFLVGAATILIVPPNNFDSMTYHLARVGYWMQHHSILPWLTADLRQVTSPMNAELGLLWTVQLWGTDLFAGFVQWMAVPFSMAAIVGIARLLGASAAQGIFASLIWATFPEIILQSTSTQNDLVTAAFFAIMVYFLVLGMRTRDTKTLLLSSLALGLALGSKVTVAFMLPGLVILLVFLWIQYGREGLRRLVIWGTGCLAAFALFGALIYAQNLIDYRSLMPSDPLEGGTEGVVISHRAYLFGNMAIYFYQALDPSGLPSILAAPFQAFKKQALPALFNVLKIPAERALLYTPYDSSFVYDLNPGISEDTSWFGPLSFLLLFPLAIYQTYLGLRRKDILRLGLVLFTVGFWISASVLLSWTPFKGRYFVLPVTMLAPLVAFIYRPSRRLSPFLWMIVFLALGISSWTVLNNTSKPLIGPNTIWGKSSTQLRSFTFPTIEKILQKVDELVPQDATLAIKLGSNGWDYPFFGPRLERKLVQVDPTIAESGISSLDAFQFDYLLVGPRQRTFLATPPGMEVAAESNQYILYERSDSKTALDPTVEIARSASDPTGLIQVQPPLVGTTGVIETWSGDWGIEQTNGIPFFWLGEGERQGLGFSVWSEQAVDARISLEVSPGPGRSDTYRSIGFITVDENNIRTTVEQSIDSPALIEFPVTLRQGFNQFGIKCLNLATVTQQPDGDARPLLVLIMHIKISRDEGR